MRNYLAILGFTFLLACDKTNYDKKGLICVSGNLPMLFVDGKDIADLTLQYSVWTVTLKTGKTALVSADCLFMDKDNLPPHLQVFQELNNSDGQYDLR